MLQVYDLRPAFSAMNACRLEDKFCDLYIKVGDRCFPCHRVVLASCTKYFQTMLSGGYIEAASKVITMNDVNPDDFHQVLDYIYGCAVPVNASNVLRFLILANYLEMTDLMKSCVEYIVGVQEPFPLVMVCDIFRFACATRCDKLIDTFIKFIALKFNDVAQSKQLDHVPAKVLIKIFSHKGLRSETSVVLNFLREWTKSQTDEEKESLPALLNAILDNLGSPPREWLVQILTNTDRDPPNPAKEGRENDVRELICTLEALEVKRKEETSQFPLMLITQDSLRCSTIEQPGVPEDSPTADDCDINLHKLRHVDKLEFVGSWLSRRPRSFSCKSFFISQTHLTFYSRLEEVPRFRFGLNRKRTARQHQIQVYARKKSAIAARAALLSSYNGIRVREDSPLIHSRQRENTFTSALNGSNVYLYNNVDFVMYSSEQNAWFGVDGYKDFLHPSMSSLGSCLYMAGGLDFSHQNVTGWKHTLRALSPGVPCSTDGKSFQRYDVRENKWSPLANMKYARTGAASCVYNDIIYVSGGDTLPRFNDPRVEYYDTRADKWSEITTPMPGMKSDHCFVAHNDQLWFFGGLNPIVPGYDFSWFSYNLKENTWSDVLYLPTEYNYKFIHRILDVHTNFDDKDKAG